MVPVTDLTPRPATTTSAILGAVPADAADAVERHGGGTYADVPDGPKLGGRADQLDTCPCGRLPCEGRRGGEATGPSPADRKDRQQTPSDPRRKRHPCAVVTTAANADDATRTPAPVDGIPPVAGRLGRSRKRPDPLLGDKGHDSNPNRREPRKHRGLPVISLKGGHGISRCPDGRRRKSPGPVDHAAVGAPR